MSSTLPNPLAPTPSSDHSSHPVRSPVPDPALFIAAFDAAPSAILLIDPATRTILAANRASGAFIGIEPAQLPGQTIHPLPIFRERPELAAACVSVTPGASVSATFAGSPADERLIEFTATGFSADGRTLVHCSLVDVTARKRHERRARQKDKMEPLRVLAGTAAHDFNNMLTCVRGYISVALEAPSLPADVREILGHVKGATTRAGELTQRLLGFSRKRKLQLAPLELGSFLNALASDLRAGLPPTLQLVIAPNAAPAPVMADAAQLRTAVESLIRNAREAIREQGRIALAASIIHDPAPPPAISATPGGAFARLTVQDDGCGMSPALQTRLFEPGVTTKKTGGTSGMSLAYAYSILADHGGWIDVQSREGSGSTFAILLPLAPATATA